MVCLDYQPGFLDPGTPDASRNLAVIAHLSMAPAAPSRRAQVHPRGHQEEEEQQQGEEGLFKADAVNEEEEARGGCAAPAGAQPGSIWRARVACHPLASANGILGYLLGLKVSWLQQSTREH